MIFFVVNEGFNPFFMSNVQKKLFNIVFLSFVDELFYMCYTRVNNNKCIGIVWHQIWLQTMPISQNNILKMILTIKISVYFTRF